MWPDRINEGQKHFIRIDSLRGKARRGSSND
jgi:hypothetical protein